MVLFSDSLLAVVLIIPQMCVLASGLYDKVKQRANMVYVLDAQWCPTLCDPVDCSPPGFSVLEILQARILEWVAIPFSRGPFISKDCTLVSHIAGIFFTN